MNLFDPCDKKIATETQRRRERQFRRKRSSFFCPSVPPSLCGRKNKYLYCFICILWLSLSIFNEAHASENKSGTVVVSGIQNEQTHAMAKEVLREAYRRIGYDIRFEFLPGKRSLEYANKGLTDGDVARIAGTEKKYPNLIPVPTPIIFWLMRPSV